MRARNHSPLDGSATTSSFDSSSRMRSALTISSRCACSSTDATSSGDGLEAEAGDEARGAEHAQRVVEERDLRRERRAESLRREVDDPAVGIDELGLGQPERHRVHGEVATGEIGLDVVAERDLGLAALGPVDLGAEGGDLHPHAAPLAADRAEPLALEPHVVGPTPHQLLDRIRPGIRREVEIGGGAAQMSNDPPPSHASSTGCRWRSTSSSRTPPALRWCTKPNGSMSPSTPAASSG